MTTGKEMVDIRERAPTKGGWDQIPTYERKWLKKRAHQLDTLQGWKDSGDGTDSINRLAILLGEADQLSEPLRALVLQAVQAGFKIWLISAQPIPAWLTPPLRQRLFWIRTDGIRSLHETFPPVDLVMATQLEQGEALYRARRPFVLALAECGSLDALQAKAPSCWLPSRLFALSEDVHRTLVQASGRKSFLWADPTPADVLADAAWAQRKDPLHRPRPRISLCMIVKNEVSHIAPCITSAYGAVDEICVVDTGSTDPTAAIAQRLGAKVKNHVWQEDFSAARNASLAMATGDWILQLDADEELTAEARRSLPEWVQRPGIDGFFLPIESETLQGTNRAYAVRLFRRDPAITYKGLIHENVGPSLALLEAKVQVVHAPIRHFGYQEDPMLATTKRQRNRTLLEKARALEPDNPWYGYYLATEEYLSGEPEKAIALLNSLSSYQWMQGEPYRLMVSCYQLMGQWQNALSVALKGTKRYPHVLDFWMFQASMGFALQDLEVCRQAVTRLHEPPLESMGNHDNAKGAAAFIEGCLSADKRVAANLWRQALPHKGAVLRPLLRWMLRHEGVQAAFRFMQQVKLKQQDPFDLVVQALVDIQELKTAELLVEAVSPERRTSAMGSVLWNNNRQEEAMRLWQRCGPPGWLRYGFLAALWGDAADLASALEQVGPLERLALKDLGDRAQTWRLAVLVPILVDLGSPKVLTEMSQLAPHLNESIKGYYQLNVLP